MLKINTPFTAGPAGLLIPAARRARLLGFASTPTVAATLQTAPTTALSALKSEVTRLDAAE